MENSFHRFPELFAQLGLASDPASIKAFIAQHARLTGAMRLDEAPFWSPAQARMLRESLHEDADWAPVVDRLNSALRSA
jgi:hypothetical protein